MRERVDGSPAGSPAGLGAGETVAMMLGNRPEFHIVDLAAMTLGAIPFSIYKTSSPEQIEYLLTDADARVAVSSAVLERFLEARDSCPGWSA